MNTDTPLTNSATFEVRTKNPVPMEVVPTSMARELERELNESNRLKNLALSRMDDALEKAESLSTPDCHICRKKCQRPLCILSKELAASKAEVERLKTVKDYWANLWADLNHAAISDNVRLEKRAEKAEAEVKSLTEKLTSLQEAYQFYQEKPIY